MEKETAIFGWPRAQLQVSADAPLADWFVRLSDVAPDGTVTLVTGAGQSGAQRESAAHPADLEPGRQYLIPIELHLTSWIFPPGHRIRAGDFECAVADDLADALPMTTSLVSGRRGNIAARIAARSVGGASAAAFSADRRMRRRSRGVTSKAIRGRRKIGR